MKTKTALLALTALVLVSGCNRGAGNNAAAANSAASNTATSNASNASASAATPAGGPVDRAFIAGTWGLDAACQATFTFTADGTVTSPSGRGQWTLEGRTLTVTENGRASPSGVGRNGDNLVLSNPANPDEQMSLTRCPAGSGAGSANASAPADAEADAETEE